MFFDQIAGSLIVKLIMPPRAAASSTSWSIVAEVTYSSFSKTDPSSRDTLQNSLGIRSSSSPALVAEMKRVSFSSKRTAT